MSRSQESPADVLTPEDEASEAFVHRQSGAWTVAEQAALETRLSSDPAYAAAFRRIEESWSALGRHGESAELMGYRQEAIGHIRKANARRWLRSNSGGAQWRAVAAFGAATVALAAAWQLSPWGYRPGEYRTDVGEQRLVELQDHSRIALDAATRLQVRLSTDARVVHLREGQAQFSVARDPARPFKVRAGEYTVVALGTAFTVEYVDRDMHVVMLEGKVAVLPPPASGSSTGDASGAVAVDGIPLSAGEELRVHPDGHITITPKADLEAATAWREGKVIFRGEPLAEAARRLNRYSQVQIEIDGEQLAAQRINGVFETGDTQGFVRAMQLYYGVVADYSSDGAVRLRPHD